MSLLSQLLLKIKKIALTTLYLQEFLMFVVPLINVQKIRNVMSRLYYSTQQRRQVSHTTITGGVACPICQKDNITIPYISNCQHIFCYYCIKQNCMMDSKFHCSVCGTRVTQIQRFNYLNINDKP